MSVGQGGEVGQRTLLLLLPANHVRLLIGSHLVRLDTRTPRVGKFGIEARFLFRLLPVFLGRGENQPHTPEEQEEHTGENQIFPDFLLLFQFFCIRTHNLTC